MAYSRYEARRQPLDWKALFAYVEQKLPHASVYIQDFGNVMSTGTLIAGYMVALRAENYLPRIEISAGRYDASSPPDPTQVYKVLEGLVNFLSSDGVVWKIHYGGGSWTTMSKKPERYHDQQYPDTISAELKPDFHRAKLFK